MTAVCTGWVDIEEPVPEQDNCRYQAQDRGAALFERGEGLWFYGGELFISATSGGRVGKGQIFRLTGVNFSPSGQTLFMNIQKQGITFAISGPFEEYAAAAGKNHNVWTKSF